MRVLTEKIDRLSASVESVQTMVLEIRDKQTQNDVHMKPIVGPPTLEERLRVYVDDKTKHRQANYEQQLLQVQTILQLENKNSHLQLEAMIKATELKTNDTENDRQNNHKENTTRLNRLERNMYIFMGFLAAAEFVLKFVFGR